MSTEREEYIRRLVEKAERERSAQGRPIGRKAASKHGRAADHAHGSPTQSRRVNRDQPDSELRRGEYPNGKNGRQAVEPPKGRAVSRGNLDRRPEDTNTRYDHSDGGINNRAEGRPRELHQKSSSRSAASNLNRRQPKSANEVRRGKTPPAGGARRTDPRAEEYQSEAHIWFSLALIFVSLYLAVSTVSYLVYWGVDEHLAYVEYLFDLRAVGAENWGGKLGAIVGNILVGQSFGLMGLGFSVLAMIGAVKALKIKTLPMRKGLRSVFLLIFTGSVALGHFAGYDPEVFGSGYGGQMGIYVASWLESVIGEQGASLLIVIGTIAILYFVNSGSLRSLVRWASHRMEHSKLQRAARMMREREQDTILREQLVEREAANAARSVAMASMIASVLESEAQPSNSESTQSPDVKHENGETLTDQSTGEDRELATQSMDTDSASDGEVLTTEAIDDNNEKTITTPYDPSSLLRLEGDQWGYIYDWDVSGIPIYLYVDRSALAVAMPALAKIAPAGTAFGSDPKNEDIEEHNIEFVVKNYAQPEEESQVEIENHDPQPSDLSARRIVDDDTSSAIEPDAITQEAHMADKSIDKEPRKAIFMPSADDPNFIVERSEGDPELDDSTINLTELYDPTLELSSYKKPPVDLMTDHSHRVKVTEEELVENKNRIVHTLETFGIKIATIEATIGPTVTLYEIIPAPGVRISKIKNLEDDIALSLSALGIRIIAPIPGRGTIGIEVPNKDKETVSMYSVIKSAKFQESKFELPIALGKTIQNETFVVDLAKMPHLLVAGATGQGKSVGLNAILASLLYKKHPSQLKFILVDPKKVELTLYAKLEKHFLAKMPGEDDAIITDTQKVIYTLNSICVEMDARYDLLKAAKVRNISEYNDKFTHRRLNPEKGHRFLPYFVVIIDEFADLIMTAGREVETPIARIAQLARAVGIHLIIATQRPTTNIITGVIKANFPARIAFRVTSMIDSRTILDSPGANQLVGRGDMLVSTGSEVTRVQCAFIDTPEVDAITEFISSQRGYVSAYELPEYVPESKDGASTSREVDPSKRDPLFDEVARYVVANQNGSASTIQRKFSIGFNRAGRLVDQLEAAGVVGGADGSKARQVLVQDPMTLEILLDG